MAYREWPGLWNNSSSENSVHKRKLKSAAKTGPCPETLEEDPECPPENPLELPEHIVRVEQQKQ